ncbi:MAG: HAMP domain-containing sensor histidine kinase, partial [Actinomycetaceae bacterium]|nr:HAMP domain-containing sensor histidine kinase [Actinomycetaceae bacterium]
STRSLHRRNNHCRSITDSHILSHEMRTPLSLIKGAGEILSDEAAGPLTDDQRHFVDIITANSQRVIAMAEDFLTDAKLSSPQFALNYTHFDLRHLIRETVRELREVNHLSLFLTDAGDPLFIDADRDLIRHVVWNLITNASRHAGPDSAITIRSYATHEGAGLEVRDHGRGITPEDRRELFVPFALGATQSQESSSGTGIGLGIVERIVNLHSGRIIVDTLTNRGTSIHVLLPWHRKRRPRRWRTLRRLVSIESRSTS